MKDSRYSGPKYIRNGDERIFRSAFAMKTGMYDVQTMLDMDSGRNAYGFPMYFRTDGSMHAMGENIGKIR